MLSWPADDLLGREQVVREDYKWEQFRTTDIENVLLVPITDGIFSYIDDRDITETCIRVIAEGNKCLRQFVFEKICNELFLVSNSNKKNIERIFSTYPN